MSEFERLDAMMEFLDRQRSRPGEYVIDLQREMSPAARMFMNPPTSRAEILRNITNSIAASRAEAMRETRLKRQTIETPAKAKRRAKRKAQRAARKRNRT